MKVTGYTLRDAISRWELRRDAAAKEWHQSLFAFKGETKEPEKHLDAWWEAEQNITILQAAQAEYNITVYLENDTKDMLAKAIKMVGSATRRVAMLKEAGPEDAQVARRRSLYGISLPNRVREKDNEYAEPTLGPKRVLDLSVQAQSHLASLRSQIAKANTSEVEIGWLDEELLQ
jgi:hypothetical protein